MNKFFLVSMFLICGIISSYAQKSKMTSAELKFFNEIESFLKEEGFIPVFDEEDNSLNFKKEGTRYWLTITGDSPSYVEMHISGFGITETNRKNLLEACNKATLETRCAKAYITDSSVSFSVEVYCEIADDFKYIFYKALDGLETAKSKAKDYYNEYE